MNNNKRVFVIQIPCRNGKIMDISKAEKFGELMPACFGTKADVTKDNKGIEKTLHEYFEENNINANDYILQSGEHTLFTKACLVASQYIDSVNILKWDRRILNKERSGGDYICISTSLDFDD